MAGFLTLGAFLCFLAFFLGGLGGHLLPFLLFLPPLRELFLPAAIWKTLGTPVGRAVGSRDSSMLGLKDGAKLELWVGLMLLGLCDGTMLGLWVCSMLGLCDGTMLGRRVCSTLGLRDGTMLGLDEGRHDVGGFSDRVHIPS
jgi:hypothetical protein